MALKFNVGEVPRTKPFQFADLAELSILVGLNSQISKADLDSLITTGRRDSDPDAEGRQDDALDVTAAHTKNAEDCFKQFGYRNGALNDIYPFWVDDAMLVSRPQIGNLGYIYLFCLICSRLGSFSGVVGFTQTCARLFTELSAAALKASLKHASKVYIFDAGSSDRAIHFHSDLRQALRKLAVMLNARPDEYLIDQQSASGDGGVDLVAVNSFSDSARGVLAYFGQCAAQQDGWPKKTLETRRSAAFFSMGHPASNLLYTPIMYRNANGGWVNDLYSQDCIIFDRLRIMRALNADIETVSIDLFNEIKAIVFSVSDAEIE